MVTCSLCNVNAIDRHCTNTPRTCFECCTTHATILTCPPHFRNLGRLAAAARLQTGMVHPHILADAAEVEVKEEEASSPPPGVLPPGGPSSPPLSSAPHPSQVAEAPRSPAPLAPQNGAAYGSATEPLTLASLAASLASVTALVQQLAARQAVVAPGSAPPAPPSAAPILPYIPLPASVPDTPALVPPPPHRAAVLDRAAVASQSDIAALVNRFSALRDDGDSDDEDAKVPTQPHTVTARAAPTPAAGILPQAFVPPPIGTEQSATQQLAAIFNALNKQGGKVKYSTIEELDEALDDWATDALKSGRTAQQVESIRAYQRLLVKQFAISDRMPLKQVLEYHRLWCKAVHAGTIDLFSQGAAMNHDIYYAVTHPLRLSFQGTAHASAQSKEGKPKAASDKTTATAPKKPVVKHPAGSCTHHPTSTSHTTAECIKKSEQ
jgi:hypothetical protein